MQVLMMPLYTLNVCRLMAHTISTTGMYLRVNHFACVLTSCLSDNYLIMQRLWGAAALAANSISASQLTRQVIANVFAMWGRVGG